MIEVHLLGSTSRIARYLGQRLEGLCLRGERVAVGYLRGSKWDSRIEKKVLVILSWSGYPSRQNRDSAEANRTIIKGALEMIRKEGYDQVIFTSSAGALYRENTSALQSEQSITCWTTSYGEQKEMAERVLTEYCEKEDVGLTILRVTTAYGFSERVMGQGAITKWVDSVVQERGIEVWIAKESKINFISYEQVADAIVRAIDVSANGILNVGCQDNVGISEVIQVIGQEAKIYGFEMKIDKWEGPLRVMRIDCRRSFRVLGKTYESEVLKDIKSIFKRLVRG